MYKTSSRFSELQSQNASTSSIHIFAEKFSVPAFCFTFLITCETGGGCLVVQMIGECSFLIEDSVASTLKVKDSSQKIEDLGQNRGGSIFQLPPAKGDEHENMHFFFYGTNKIK